MIRRLLFAVPLGLALAVTGIPDIGWTPSGQLTVEIGSEAEAKSKPRSPVSKPKPPKVKPAPAPAKPPKPDAGLTAAPAKPPRAIPAPAPVKPTTRTTGTVKPPKAIVPPPAKPGQRMDLRATGAPNLATVKRVPSSAMAASVTRARSSAAYAARQTEVNRLRSTNPLAKTLPSTPIPPRLVAESRQRAFSAQPRRVQENVVARQDRYNDAGGFDSTLLLMMMFSEDPGAGMFWYGIGTGNPALIAMGAMARDNGDTELEARIAAIEAENAALKAAGTTAPPVEATLASMNISPEAALSEEMLTGVAKIPLKTATGGTGGQYYGTCQAIIKALGAQFDVSCKPTAGGPAGLQLANSGGVDAYFAPNDVMFTRGVFLDYSASIYPEPVFVFVHKDSGFNHLEDLNPPRHTLLAGPQGSGTLAGMENLVQIEYDNSNWSDLKHLRGKFKPSPYMAAVDRVAADPTVAAFYIAGIQAPFLAEVEAKHGGTVCLLQVVDKDLNDLVDDNGNSVFDTFGIPGSMFPKLACGQSEIATVAVPATFNLAPAWVARYGKDAALSVLTGLGHLYQ